MRLFLILLLVLPLSSFSQEVAFMCKGKLSENYPNQGLSWKDSHPETKDELGVVVNGNKLSIKSGKSIIKMPQVFSKNGDSKFSWDLDICTNKNHEITFNNYSCDIKIFDKGQIFGMTRDIVYTFNGSFDGVTKALLISVQPLELYKLRFEKKEPILLQNGVYSCTETKPSF
jgi:hypothetical protein